MARPARGPNGVALPRRVAVKQQSGTGWRDGGKGNAIAKDNQPQYSQTVRALRNSGQVIQAIRELADVNGSFGSAVFSYVQVANSGYSVRAYDPATHEYSTDGTALARSVLASLDTLYDYTGGFADKMSFDSLVRMALREAALTSMCAGELVMNKQRFPERIVFAPAESLQWVSKGDGTRFPRQQASGGNIDLDIPTFWVAELERGANKAYASPIFAAALDEVFYYLEFIEDMRRAVRRSGHTRLTVTLNTEKVQASAPPETKDDPEKMRAYMESVQKDVESVVSGMEPEDALVMYDTAVVDSITADRDKQDYTSLMETLAGMAATAMKSNPSTLGLRLAGSQSLSNTESLVFIKNAASLHKPVEEFFSRALTLAVRLYGSDVYVKFRMNPINLRPEDELEAFRTMRQDNVLELLSLGYLSDDEASEMLGYGARVPGAPNLAGTLFFQRKNSVSPSPNSDPMGRALQPDTPKKGGGDSQ